MYQHLRNVISAWSDLLKKIDVSFCKCLIIYLWFTLIDGISVSVVLYQRGSTDEESIRRDQVMCRVVIAVLNTMVAFVDWVNVTFITERNGVLLEVLCAMLSDTSLQLHAAECMLVITNRKVFIFVHVLWNLDKSGTCYWWWDVYLQTIKSLM